MKFAFVLAEKAYFPVTVLCKCMGVSPSGFYEWLERPPSTRQREDAKLLEKLADTHAKHKRRYGSRRHRADLLESEMISVGRNRVRRLMKAGNLHARQRRPYKVTTKSDHEHPVADNHLDRKFQPALPNQAWVGDITYLPTSEGWLYLAVVIDLYSRRVVGWAMSTLATRQLVLDALQMALGRREVGPGLLLFHSDRGVQYASRDFRKALQKRQITPSMSRRGNCWDNAVAESFFASLETELLDEMKGASRETVGQAVFDYIERYYNRQRLHSTLGYKTPAAFEAQAINRRCARPEGVQAA